MTDERFHHDPFDQMSDDELDDYFAAVFETRREPTVPVTLRMPEDLLRRTKRIAEEQHVPYQRLIKDLLEASVALIERRGVTQRRNSA